MAKRSAKALAWPGVGEATARMSAWGQARSASAWMLETNCDPIRPTPTRCIAQPLLGAPIAAAAAPTMPARPPSFARATVMRFAGTSVARSIAPRIAAANVS